MTDREFPPGTVTCPECDGNQTVYVCTNCDDVDCDRPECRADGDDEFEEIDCRFCGGAGWIPAPLELE